MRRPDTAGLRRLLAVARILVPAIVLVALWRALDGEAALARLSEADAGWLAAAFVAANLQVVLCALRWRFTAERLGLVIARGRAIGDYYMAQLLNQTLPGGVLGDVARAVRTRESAGLERAGQAVVIERMAGQIALFAVTALGLVVAVATPGGIRVPEIEVPTLVPIALTVAAVAALVFAVGRLRSVLARFVGASRVALLAPGARLPQATLSLGIVAANLATFAFAARATGTAMPLEGVLVLVPLVLTAMLLPLSIGGWGFREGTAAALFPLVGASAEAGFAASLAFGLVVLAASLPGLIPLARPRAAAPPTLPDTSPQ